MANDGAGLDADARASALSPFRSRVFRNVWWANLLSQFGGMIQSVGASWLMLSITASAGMVTLVQASTTLPIALLALVAGALADNFDRRRMMIGSQVFMLIVSAALAACAYVGLITPWLLLLFTFLIGSGAAFNNPAWQASVREMVPREQLPAAVALNSMGFNVARSVGPAIGGLVVAAVGAAAAFGTNAVTYLGIIAVLALWRPVVERRVLPRERLGAAMLAGIRYVAMSPSISVTLLRSFVFGAGASALTALMPLIAKELVGGGPVTYGLLLGAFGVGAVGGAFLTHRLHDTLSSESIVRCALVAFGSAAAIAAYSTWLPVTMLAMLVGGAGWVLALATFNVTVQMSAPRWVVGRALSLYQMVTFCGIAGGSWIWGLLTERADIASALLLSALVLAGGVVLGLRYALPETTSLNLDPHGRWKEPAVGLPIEPRSGPVVVTIEYRIRASDALEFLSVMEDRKRIKRRNGARRWMLLRDLADPEVWIERYDAPTWVDYVRQNQRVTQDDALVWERVRALHCDADPPRVRRMLERQTGSLPSGADAAMTDLAQPLTDPARLS